MVRKPFQWLMFFVWFTLLYAYKHRRGRLRLADDNNRTVYKTLLDLVFERYDKRMRPYAEDGRPVVVNMTVVLGILIELRENEQVAAYVISHIQRWRDPQLSWNPSFFNNVTELIVPESMVWVPKMFVYNSMDTKYMLTDNRYDVRLTYDGIVKANIPQYVTCICRLYIEQFPFDTQYCAVTQASPLLTVHEMDVRALTPPRDSYFAGNAEWNLINVTVRHFSFQEEGEDRPEVHYIFQLRRRSVFYITVIVVPIFLISALSILGIFTPSADSGPRNEKVSLGLGSLLSMTVILGILASAMPKSNSIPLLGYFILAVIVLCALAVGLSMGFLTLSRRLIQRCRVPSEFTYRMVCLRPRLFAVKQVPRHSIFRPSFSMPIHPHNGIDNGNRNNVARNMNNRSMKEINHKRYNANNSANIRHMSVRESLLPRAQIAEDRLNVAFQVELLNHIYSEVKFLADENSLLKKKIERRQMREIVAKEWSRVFSRLDYVLLTVFEALNAVTLVFFLQFAWVGPPPMREPLV